MVNSPGEVNGWAAPIVRDVRPKLRKPCITLVIPPCQYASGNELEYGMKVEGVDRCISVWKALLSGGAEECSSRLVLHLGGDLLYSVLLSRCLGSPLYVYSARPRWRRFVEHYFLPDASAEKLFALHGLPKSQYSRVGHLALDSVVLKETESESRARLGYHDKQPLLAFMTGSRPIEYREGMPFFTEVASRILDKHPEYQVLFPMAPTIDPLSFLKCLDENRILWRGQSRVREVHLGKGRWGRVLWDFPLEALNCCRLAVAVPGTNNMQLAALYVPYVMVLPLNKAEEYPLDGIGGWLPLWLPGIKWLKRHIIFGMNRRIPYVSLPNRLANRLIAPEVRGIITPDDVALKALELLASPEKRDGISRAFWELTHERGASARIAAAIGRRLS